jgi:CBS-domain-containing membrane protein
VLDLANSWICRPSGPVRSPVRPGHCGDAGRTDFVNSLSNAAIAAGLASSVVIIFVNPSNRTARIRSVVGGHGLALVLGSAFSLLLFFGPVVAFLDDLEMLRNLAYAAVVGLSVLLMAITNSEHPPAAATAIGMASREFDVAIFGSIIGAVLMLVVIKLALRPHLRDLT